MARPVRPEVYAKAYGTGAVTRRQRAEGLVMHFLIYKIKRAHLRALAAARPFSLRVGLTPTRYDYMNAIIAFRFEPPQHLLWRVLGISRTSASKMVRRLIELGLVQRRRAPRDRRTFLVSLTKQGEKRYRRTFLQLFRKRPFQRRFERAFGDRSWKTFRAVDRLSNALSRVAIHLGDTAWTLYATRPLRFGPLRVRGGKMTALCQARTPTRPQRSRPGLTPSRRARGALKRTG